MSGSWREKYQQEFDDVYPRFAQFIYYSVITISGFLLVTFLGRGEDGQSMFEFWTSFGYMVVWLAIIILLQPPEPAQLQSEPFEKQDIIPKYSP